MYPLSHNYVILIIEIVAPNFNLTVNARICTRFHHGCYSGQFVCVTFVYLITASDDVVWYWQSISELRQRSLPTLTFILNHSKDGVMVSLITLPMFCSFCIASDVVYFIYKTLYILKTRTCTEILAKKGFLCEGCLTGKFSPHRLFNLRFLYKGFYFISVDAWSHSKNLMVHHDKYCLASRKWDVGRKSADCP